MHMAEVNRWMREKAKWFLIGICVIIMVVWLVPFNYLLARRVGQEGKIFGKTVPGQTVFWLARTLSSLSRRSLDAQTLTQTWQALILAEEAKQYGIAATDEEVVEVLTMHFPAASGMGYDAKAYAAALARADIPEQAYESSLKIYLTALMLAHSVQMSVTLPESEAWLWYARENERVMAEYVALRAEAFAPLVVADDKSLQEFYEEYKNTPPDRDPNGVGYLQPEEVSIEYLLCPYARYLDDVVVTQQQVNAYYNAHKERYSLPSTPKAAQPNEPPKFKPLAEVAPEIEAELRKEEAARAVEGEMKEVNDEIAAETETPTLSEEVRYADFGQIAKKFDLIYRITPLFAADQVQTILPGANELASKAFGQSASSIRQPSATLDARDGKFVFQILKIQDPVPAPYEAVRTKVEKDYRTAKGYELAQEMADAALKDNPTSLDAAATKIQAAIAERLKTLAPAKAKEAPESYVQRGKSDFFTRPVEYAGRRFALDTGLPGNYNYTRFVDEAFTLKDNEVGKALEPNGARTVFLLKRIAVKPADRAEFEKNIANITGGLLARKQEAVLQSWLADVRQAARPSPEVLKYLGS
jgi:hypothetical protein